MDMGNATQKTIWYVDYWWVDERVRKYLGIEEYEFLAAQESSNDTAHEFTVQKELTSDYDKEYQPQDVREAQAGDWTFKTGSLLDELCIRGHIEPGEYIVRVCW